MIYLCNMEQRKVIASFAPNLHPLTLQGLAAFQTAQSGMRHEFISDLPEDIYKNSFEALNVETGIEDVLAWADAIDAAVMSGNAKFISDREVVLAVAIRDAMHRAT